MPKNHRSFFERLTGSVNAVEDDEEEIVREPMITTEKTKSAAKAGDWMNEEEEGQLAVDVFQTPSEIIIIRNFIGAHFHGRFCCPRRLILILPKQRLKMGF